MIKAIYSRLFINGRTAIVLRNSFLSLFLKGISIVVSFILVPISLQAVGKKQYGIILTITSVINWIAFFDIGMGNGLRTKLGKCIAENDRVLGRKYVSTAYFYIASIFLGILVLYTIAHPFINWYDTLNINGVDVPGLNSCMYFLIALFIVRFILQLIGVILLADQQSYLNDVIMPVSNLLTLGLIYFFYHAGIANFYLITFSICAAPVLVFVGYTYVLFRGRYKWLRPSFKMVDHGLRKDLLSLGAKFFFVQIAALIMFSSSNFIIAKLFSMEEVTLFNIGSRYYGVSLMLFGIILTPLWGAFTNAWYQGDKNWIASMIRKMVFLNMGLLILGFVMLTYYEPISKWWLSETISLTPVFAITLILYNFHAAFNNILSYFLNAIGKVNIQLYSAICGGIITVPATIFLFRNTQLGLASICVANMMSLLPGTLLCIVQVKKILSGRAKGIWLS